MRFIKEEFCFLLLFIFKLEKELTKLQADELSTPGPDPHITFTSMYITDVSVVILDLYCYERRIKHIHIYLEI